MCGICGICGPGADRAVLEGMARTLVHRGPDDEGYLVRPGIGLGIRRLSVIDVEGGHQPVHNEDRSVWVILNGEIYNFVELRTDLESRGHRFSTRGDTEVIVHLYEEYGLEGVRRMNGMFAFALWDDRSRRLVLGRDRLGVKPLYYTRAAGAILFSSELKALCAHPGVGRRLHLPALKKYLMYEFIPAPLTVYQDIWKLPPAHILTVDGGAISLHRYWGLSCAPQGPLTEEDARGELLRLIRSSVALRMRSDVPVGVFLSGGVDSSMVAGMMAEIAPGRVKSFSIGFDDPSFDESGWARLAARHIGTDHHERVLGPADLPALLPRVASFLDEPLGDASIIPTYALSGFARERVTVALGGDGGDEIFGGYPTYQAHRLADMMEHAPVWGLGPLRAAAGALPVRFGDWSFDFRARRFLAGLHHSPHRRHQMWMGSFTEEEATAVLAVSCPGDPLEDARRLWQECDAGDAVGKIQHLDLSMYLQDDILAKVDRASMACSLEVRSPYLDYRVVEFMASLPTRMKLRRWTRKYLLGRAAKGFVPETVIRRKKKGFGIPVARWINSSLRDVVDDLLDPRGAERTGIFRGDILQGLLADHRALRADHRKKIWTLLMFETWRRRYAPS